MPDVNTAKTESSRTSTFRNVAGTAAGVAAGSAVGHVIGNALSTALEHGHIIKASSNEPNETQEQACTSEIRQFFECASRNENLDACKIFHNIWFDCEKRQNARRS